MKTINESAAPLLTFEFIFRKLLHALVSLAAAIAILLLPAIVVFIIGMVILLTGIYFEWLMLSGRKLKINKVLANILHFVNEPPERYLHSPQLPGQGALMLNLAVLISLVIFSQETVARMLLIFGVADSSAAVGGKLLPLVKIGRKSLGGFLMFFLLSVIVLFLFTKSILIALIGALIFAAAELFFPFDDTI